MKPEKLESLAYHFGDSRDDIANAIAGAIENKLSPEARGFEIDKLRSECGELSLRDICADALARITTECKGGFRILAKPRKGDSLGFVLLERWRWHLGSGSGNLHSVFGSRYRVSNSLWEFADTFAMVFAYIASGGKARSHSERWAQALGKA